MFRTAVAVALATTSLCLPVSGGKSDAFVADLVSITRATPIPTERPKAVTSAATVGEPAFPRFVRPLSTDRPGAATWPAGQTARELLLSFDDGPDLLGTPLVLDELDRRGLKAIFFVTGSRLVGSRPQALATRDLVRKLAAHGHLVANHTLTHKNLCRFPDAVADEVDFNSEIISYATGVRPILFRSPYGARCRKLDEALRERDLLQIGWSIDPQDWRGEDHQAILRYVIKKLIKLSGRAILLLHDTHPGAVRALPEILRWIDEENRRVKQEGGLPIRIVDYSVFVPERPIASTGLEPVLGALASAFTAVPGIEHLGARF